MNNLAKQKRKVDRYTRTIQELDKVEKHIHKKLYKNNNETQLLKKLLEESGQSYHNIIKNLLPNNK